MTDQQICFTKKQQEMLNKYIKFYRSLDRGTRVPESQAQKHFVLVCRGQSQIQTEHEFVYIKHRNLCNRQKEILKQALDRQQQANQKIRSKYKSNNYKKATTIDKFNKYKKTSSINADWKQAERENISRTLLRQKRISNTLVTFSD
jgi:uncharacterized protein YifE (UPF0438 family)